MALVRRSMRLEGFDYSRSGAYFVTICTRDQLCLFGEIDDGQMHCNALGEIVASCWDEIPGNFPRVTLDAFVVMPNHVHGILLFTDVVAGHARPLPAVVGSFKSAVSRRARPGVWQRSYWDRIIRNEDELNLARHYIDENPARWSVDDGRACPATTL